MGCGLGIEVKVQYIVGFISLRFVKDGGLKIQIWGPNSRSESVTRLEWVPEGTRGQEEGRTGHCSRRHFYIKKLGRTGWTGGD